MIKILVVSGIILLFIFCVWTFFSAWLDHKKTMQILSKDKEFRIETTRWVGSNPPPTHKKPSAPPPPPKV